MSKKTGRLILLLLLVVSFVMPISPAMALQTATPPATPAPQEMTCLPDRIVPETDVPSYGNDIHIVTRCGTYNEDLDQFSVLSQLTFDANAGPGIALTEWGVNIFTVHSGTLTLKMVDDCVFTTICGGTAEVGRASGGALSSLSPGEEDTLNPGDYIVMQNVTMTVHAGTGGAFFSAFGVFPKVPGSCLST